jgi:hypothetical protein
LASAQSRRHESQAKKGKEKKNERAEKEKFLENLDFDTGSDWLDLLDLLFLRLRSKRGRDKKFIREVHLLKDS